MGDDDENDRAVPDDGGGATTLTSTTKKKESKNGTAAEGDGDDTSVDRERRTRQRTNDGVPEVQTSINNYKEDASSAVSNDDEEANVDRLLAQEMLQLSVDDREKVFLDIHGVPERIPESPELIQQSLCELREELARQSANSEQAALTLAYREAQAQNPDYVVSDELLLPILRCDQFRIKEAAIRIFRFLGFKKYVFGVECLTKVIRLSDLGKEGREWLELGGSQILPLPDRSNRPVVISYLPLMMKFSQEAPQKAFFYLICCLLENEDNHRNGMVVVTVNTGPGPTVPVKESNVEGSSEMMKVIPIRFECSHIVSDDPGYDEALKDFIHLHEERRDKVRIRLHRGSVAQNKLALSSVGIPVDVLPFDEAGTLTNEYQKLWLKARKQSEDSQQYAGEQMAPTKSTMEVQPTDDDVLTGNAAASSHPGNLRYHAEVKAHFEEYEAAKGSSKKFAITRGIIYRVSDWGGRFLKKEVGGGWTIMNDDEAHVKASMAFRDLRKAAVVARRREEEENMS